MPDPHSKVSGKGIKELRKQGIKVELDILREECEWFNQKYLVNITKKKNLCSHQGRSEFWTAN